MQELQTSEDKFRNQMSSFKHSVQEASVFKEESASRMGEVCFTPIGRTGTGTCLATSQKPADATDTHRGSKLDRGQLVDC